MQANKSGFFYVLGPQKRAAARPCLARATTRSCRRFAGALSSDDIEDVAAYYAGAKAPFPHSTNANPDLLSMSE